MDLPIEEYEWVQIEERYKVSGAYYFGLEFNKIFIMDKTEKANIQQYWQNWIEENLTNYIMIGKWDVRVHNQDDAVLIKMTWC